MSEVAPLHERIQAVRSRLRISQADAGQALGMSQPTYSRVEDGSRPLKGSELVRLADAFGVRVAAITGIADVSDRARYAARTDGSQAGMVKMRDHLYAYLELDAYLTEQGFTAS
jgi:transcriptional regulator with XRE-family HTH domain